MYAETPESFDELIAPVPAELGATAEWIRRLILDEFPQVEENIYGGKKMAMALYSVGGRNSVALGIQPGRSSVKLYVHHPELLGDTPFRLEGRGRHMRHIKFTAPPVERRAELLTLIGIPVGALIEAVEP